MSDSHAKSHVKSYLVVYITLLVLVAVTVAVAHVKTGPLAFPIAMAVAGFKTLLIVAVFMHVKDELPLVRVFAVIGAFWLLIMFTFMLCDYLTRAQTGTVRAQLQGAAAHVQSPDQAPVEPHPPTLKSH